MLTFLRQQKQTYDFNKSFRSFIVKSIGYNPKNINVFKEAFTHRSVIPKTAKQMHKHAISLLPNQVLCSSNQRLEYLGDAVINLVVADYLYINFLDKTEGTLTKLRSKIVSTKTLSYFCKKLSFHDWIIIGDNTRKDVVVNSTSVLADLFEAVIAAIYVDKGFKYVKIFFQEKILSNIDLNELLNRDTNYKSLLLEVSQQSGQGEPTYTLVEEIGPAHEKIFIVNVLIQNNIIGIGQGRTKKSAEQYAAKKALLKISPQQL